MYVAGGVLLRLYVAGGVLLKEKEESVYRGRSVAEGERKVYSKNANVFVRSQRVFVLRL